MIQVPTYTGKKDASDFLEASFCLHIYMSTCLLVFVFTESAVCRSSLGEAEGRSLQIQRD